MLLLELMLLQLIQLLERVSLFTIKYYFKLMRMILTFSWWSLRTIIYVRKFILLDNMYLSPTSFRIKRDKKITSKFSDYFLNFMDVLCRKCILSLSIITFIVDSWNIWDMFPHQLDIRQRLLSILGLALSCITEGCLPSL